MTARLVDCELAYLWLEEEKVGDFVCAAFTGVEGDEVAEALTRYRLPRLEAEALIEMTVEPRLVPACELSRFFRQADLRDLGPLAVASLPPGHGVRGWLAMGRPAALGGGFSGERLRLLEGLAYRTAMALERERLARYQQQSLEVADALLDYARALARIEPGDDARDGGRPPGGGDPRRVGRVAVASGRGRWRACSGCDLDGRRRPAPGSAPDAVPGRRCRAVRGCPGVDRPEGGGIP